MGPRMGDRRKPGQLRPIRAVEVVLVVGHEPMTPPCACGLPLVRSDDGCPRCGGAHWKALL